MDKSIKRWLVIFGVVLLVGLILLALILGWFAKRGKTFNSRPLVLIHSPHNNDLIQVGERIVVHATAREDQGLDRIELWVDGTLVDEVEAPETNPTNLVISSSWTTHFAGNHLLVVQAISKDGVNGQGSIRVLAVEADQSDIDSPPGEDGEVADVIDGGDGGSAEGGDGGSAEGGDGGSAEGGDGGSAEDTSDAIGPGGEPAPEDTTPSTDEERSAPFPAGDAPLMGSLFDVFDFFSPPAERIPLRLEIILLRTFEDYGGMHCYVSLANSLPQWYPDVDLNQATDESFPAKGHGWWETDPFLEGESAPIISWPGDQSLPLTISCVGIAGGGTEAVDLGQTVLVIPPEEWNGIQKNISVEGVEGGFFFAYRVSQVESMPRRVSKYIDPDMPQPTNLRINDPGRTLEWDFEPDPEEPIDGFRIYLNETLQWTERRDARESRLPNEWLNPPCASTYTFKVSTFRFEFPDSPESEPVSVDLVQDREGCVREMRVEFVSLETFNLGDDGDSEERHGDVGPAYGSFFANENRIAFDGGEEGSGLDRPSGLSHNSTYDLGAMAADPGWRFNRGRNSTIVEVPIGGSLVYGFEINDRDNNPDDLICAGTSRIFDESRTGDFNRVHENVVISDNRQCDVVVRWGPAFDSPIGGITEGEEPLPWLQVTDLTVDETTGEVFFDIRNTGIASWARDLEVELQSRRGDSLGIFTWEEYDLLPGEYDTLHQTLMSVGPPYDACILIDPNNEVLEEGEILGTTAHGPYCPQMPDLIITDAYYHVMRDGGRIRVKVQNTGSETLEARTLEFQVRLNSGRVLDLDDSIPGITITPGGMRTLELGGVTEEIREEMIMGYSVTVNPGPSVVETNYHNNSFMISAAQRIALNWYSIDAPYDAREWHSFHFDAYIVTGRHREQIADWDVNQDISWGSCGPGIGCTKHFSESGFSTSRIQIYGDQLLEIVVTLSQQSLREGFSRSHTYFAPSFSGGEFNPNTFCEYYPMREAGIHRWILDYLEGQSWKTRFDICWEDYGLSE